LHDALNAMAPSRIPYSFHDSWLYACINHAAIVHDGKEVKAAVVEPAQTEPGKQRIGGKGCEGRKGCKGNRTKSAASSWFLDEAADFAGMAARERPGCSQDARRARTPQARTLRARRRFLA